MSKNRTGSTKNGRFFFATVDCGGTYIKAAVYDNYGKQLGKAKHKNLTIAPEPAFSEYDQERLWLSASNCINNAIVDANIEGEEICCISVCAQGSGFYAVDNDGKNIRNAITSSDRRAQVIADYWRENGISEKVYKEIYRYPLSGHLSTILRWLKENEPENYGRIKYLFSMRDFLVFKMTGIAVSGRDCASVSGLLNLNSMKFDPAVADVLELREMSDKFGKLTSDTEICGPLSKEAALACGCSEGTPVAMGAHDVIAAAVALGICEDGQSFIVTGTHAINGYISSSPVLDHIIKNNELYAIPGMYLIEEGYPSSSATLEWVIDTLKLKRNEKIYEEINEKISRIPFERSCPYFLPYLKGNRDNPRIRCCFMDLCSEHSQEDLLRSVYEGVVFSHMIQLEYLFKSRKGGRPAIIKITGGASKSEVWMQMFADAMGIPVELVKEEESGAKGAAMLAAVAVGVYSNISEAYENMKASSRILKPDISRYALYQKKYERFKKFVKAVETLY